MADLFLDFYFNLRNILNKLRNFLGRPTKSFISIFKLTDIFFIPTFREIRFSDKIFLLNFKCEVFKNSFVFYYSYVGLHHYFCFALFYIPVGKIAE